jgi:CRP-like cAMP-binding protein
MARNGTPDLVLCDIMMPVLDGYGVLHLFRRDEVLSQIPFVFMTAKSERSDHRKAMELGADDYLTKPFTELELLAAIETRIQKGSSGPSPSASPRRLEDAKNQLHNFVKGVFNEERSEIIKVGKKHVLYSVGQYPQSIFWLEKGIVKKYRTNSFGKTLIGKICNGPELLGLTEALLQNPYQSFCEASTPLEIRTIPREKLIKALSENGPMLMYALQLQAEENNKLSEKMLQLAYTPMRDRVLFETNEVHKLLAENGFSESDKVFSREELAQISGTATESLIRVLHEK